jgi:hypothetical protein
MRLVWLSVVLCAGCWTKVITVESPPPILVVDPGHGGGMVVGGAGDLGGRWAGRGYQYNNNSSWDIDLALRPGDGGIAGTIDYPSIGCSGELDLVSDEGQVLVVRERLTVNPRNICVDGGTIKVVMRVDGALDWRWYYDGGGEGASAVMTRR